MMPVLPGKTGMPARPVPIRSGVIPALHLARIRAAWAPRICLVGDSTGTLEADNVATADTLSPMLMRRLRQDNPHKRFVFLNLSIGGTAWSNAAAQTEAIRRFAPDLVVTNYGLNCPENAYSDFIQPFLAMLAALPKVPDCILITNKTSNPAVAGDTDTYLAGAANQRSIAASNGNGFAIPGQPNIGLIDIGRHFQIAVHGADPATQFLTRAAPIAPCDGDDGFPLVLPRCDGDFGLKITFPGMGAAFEAARTIIMVDVPNTLHFETINGATFHASYLNARTEPIVGNLNNWSPDDVTIRVMCKGEHLSVRTNEHRKLALDTLVPRAAGPFSPRISLLRPPEHPRMIVDSYSFGTMQKHVPMLTPAQAYGEIGGPHGGNGFNHFSSLSLNAIDWAVLEATDFCAG